MKLVTSEDIEPTKEELSAIENEEKLKSWSDDEKMSLEELIEETSEFLKRNRRTIH